MKRLAVVLLLTSGCALTRNAPPLDVEYFSVEPPRTTTHAATIVPSAPALALGRVRSSQFLRNRIVYREPNDALREYERFRWTEYPEAYLRRALDRVLFDDGRFAESLGRDVPTLDVELVAFEEVRRDHARGGRVQVDYRLHTGTRVIASDAVTVERPAAAGSDMAPIVDALEGALTEATAKIASDVERALRAP